MKTNKKPILFMIFNRYHTTIQVFNSIRKEQPEKLYIAADGPRKNTNDKKKCIEVRGIIKKIDWECEVFTLFQDDNLGPMRSQMTAINWFFKYEKDGVILEDDSLPNESFFKFCNSLLDRYKNDKRISMISGCNYQQKNKHGNSDYYFSKYTNTCGWATWKRSWDNVKVDFIDWPKLIDAGMMEDFSNIKGVKRKFIDVFDTIYANRESRGWDYRFMYASLKNGALSIVPNVNLIKNIGFGPGATNCINTDSPEAMLDIFNIDFPLRHPYSVFRNFSADEFEGKNNHYKRSTMEKIMYYSISWKKLYNILKVKYLGGIK
jgi:hypothetical protein